MDLFNFNGFCDIVLRDLQDLALGRSETEDQRHSVSENFHSNVLAHQYTLQTLTVLNCLLVKCENSQRVQIRHLGEFLRENKRLFLSIFTHLFFRHIRSLQLSDRLVNNLKHNIWSTAVLFMEFEPNLRGHNHVILVQLNFASEAHIVPVVELVDPVCSGYALHLVHLPDVLRAQVTKHSWSYRSVSLTLVRNSESDPVAQMRLPALRNQT